jgi:Xaa-Pro aminopeptidase
MEAQRLHVMLVTEMAHIRYLSGFSGSYGICAISADKQVLITDYRYKDQVKEEVEEYKIVISKRDLLSTLIDKKIFPLHTNIGFESQHLSIADLSRFKKILPKRRFVPTFSFIENIAAIKDENEIEMIRMASSISDKVFQKILPCIHHGVRECEIAGEISYYHRYYGAESDAFEPIVASGIRSAFPHSRASEKKITDGEMVVLDFGCKYRGYHSDLTRTISVGKPLAEMKKIHQIVCNAQQRTIDRTAEGITASSIDFAARNYIKENKYGRYFNHSLGHGIGIHLHEPIDISERSSTILKKDNVITIEPGIYLPAKWGVRIEDMIVVKDFGCEVLTQAPKELISV